METTANQTVTTKAIHPFTSVTLLLAADGKICSVYADRAAAEARRDRFNADPFIEPGTPDPDAPYSTKTWGLTVE